MCGTSPGRPRGHHRTIILSAIQATPLSARLDGRGRLRIDRHSDLDRRGDNLDTPDVSARSRQRLRPRRRQLNRDRQTRKDGSTARKLSGRLTARCWPGTRKSADCLNTSGRVTGDQLCGKSNRNTSLPAIQPHYAERKVPRHEAVHLSAGARLMGSRELANPSARLRHH